MDIIRREDYLYFIACEPKIADLQTHKVLSPTRCELVDLLFSGARRRHAMKHDSHGGDPTCCLHFLNVQPLHLHKRSDFKYKVLIPWPRMLQFESDG